MLAGIFRARHIADMSMPSKLVIDEAVSGTVEKVMVGETVVPIRRYADGRFGFDYYVRRKRFQLRRKAQNEAADAARRMALDLALKSDLPPRRLRFETTASALPAAPINLDQAAAEKSLKNLYYECSKRARRANLECSITVELMIAAAVAQNWRCVLSGLPFRTRKEGWAKNPYAPSIDRIDCARGYTPDNTRLVCYCVNASMNQWGFTVFAEMCRGFATMFGSGATLNHLISLGFFREDCLKQQAAPGYDGPTRQILTRATAT
jgi:hypothetical protein